MKISNGDMITGECACCGVEITGPAGTVAQPTPFMRPDLFSGPVRCWAVSVDGGMPHDVPVRVAKPVTP